ncbi:MAG: hypothetical protein ICV82_03765 [Nitrososphaera sp.]|nr:hypothetical protein [Nitrososphaera sp.]
MGLFLMSLSKQYPLMDLLMFIDGNHISSITINEASTEEPQFFVDGVPSSMNFFASFDADQLINQVLYPRRNKNKE